jgi:hypothetical protein
MPPDGYNTVTLPYDLLETIDGLTDMSRAATIRMLVAEYNDGVDEREIAQEVTDLVAGGEIRIDPEAIADAVAERVEDDRPDVPTAPVTLEAGEYAKIADEVEGRMR